jgi:uncharacterized protein HemX
MFGLLGLSRIQLYIAAAIALSGIYYYWKNSIEQEALMEYNQKQLEQSIEDQKKLKAALDEIQQKQADIIKQTEEDKKAFDQKLSVVDTSIDNSKQDRPSSDILKNTVKQLKELSK